MKLIQSNDYLLLIDEGAEIKEGNYFLGDERIKWSDSDSFSINKCECIEGANYVMSNGIGYQKEYNAFLLIAYYPLKEAKELDLPLLPNPFEDRWEWFNNIDNTGWQHISPSDMDGIIAHGLHPEPQFRKNYRQFSLEDMKKAIGRAYKIGFDDIEGNWKLNEVLEEIIQSLSTQQLPKEFIPEYKDFLEGGLGNPIEVRRFKTIINSEGKMELIGKYK